MSAMDQMQQKIREVRQHAAAIDCRLSVPEGSVFPIDQLRAEVDEIMAALIVIDQLADRIEMDYYSTMEAMER